MADIKIARNAGFCFGVRRATGLLEEALKEREIEYGFTTSDFWIWQFVGSFFLIGHFVYVYKLCKAMNLLCADYNKRNGI